MSYFEFDEEKFAEMILYIAGRTMDHPEFGAIKMAKALWHSEREHFERHGRPIAGAEYARRDFGPAPTQYLPTRKALEEKRQASIAYQEIGGRRSKRVVALREASLNVFDQHEISVIDGAIERVKAMTAKEASDATHGIVWELSEPGEEIPLSAGLVSDVPLQPTEAEIEYGREIAQQLS